MEGDRGYQRFCFARAQKENVICALPTGAGKTRVAIRLLQACQDLLNLPNKAAVFLCPSVALCMQQADVAAAAGLKVALLASGSMVDLEKKRLETLNAQQPSTAGTSSIAPSDIEVMILSNPPDSEAVPAQHTQHKRRRLSPDREVEGSHAPSVSAAPSKASTGTDATIRGPVHQLSNRLRAGPASREHVANVLRECQLVVATPGELLACLTHALIKVHNVAVVILDEAHHCSANHAYAQLLDNFLVVLPLEKRPRLLGLTATPLQILEPPAPDTGSKLCSLEVLANARIIGAPDWSEVEQLVPKPTQRLLGYKQPPLQQHPVIGPLGQQLDAAQRVLATVQALHKHRAIIRQSLRLVKAKDAAAAVVADAGRVHSGGRTVFEYMAQEVAAIQNSLNELGLWAALLVTQHTLLSSNQSSLIMALDPEFQLDDDDDSDTEQDGGAQKALDVGLQLPSMSASLQLQGDLARLRAECDKLRKKLLQRVHADQDRPPPDMELEQLASKLAVQMVMDALGEAVEEALSRMVGEGVVQEHPLDTRQLAQEVFDGLRDHGLRGLMEGKLAHLVPQYLLPHNDHLSRLWHGTHSAPKRGPIWHPKGKPAAPPEPQPVPEGIWFTDKLRKLMHLVMNPRPNIPRGPLAQPKTAPSNGTPANGTPANGTPANGTPVNGTPVNGTASAQGNPASAGRNEVAITAVTANGTGIAANGSGSSAVAGAAAVDGAASAAGGDGGTVILPEQTMVFFAQKVYTVVVDQLVKLLPEAQQAGLISCCFMGDTGGGSLSLPLSMGLNAQRRVMTAFRTGAVNLLLATHVGAEGLDFGCCSRVVLMDVPPHVIQLTQCKGRARLPGSECVLLVPESDLQQQRQLEELNRIEVAMTQAIIKRTAQYVKERGLSTPITTNMGPPPPRPPLSQRGDSALTSKGPTFGTGAATEGATATQGVAAAGAADMVSERSRTTVRGPWDVVTETVVVSSGDAASNIDITSLNEGGSMAVDAVVGAPRPATASEAAMAMDVDTASELASVASDLTDIQEKEMAAAVKEVNMELLEEVPKTLVVHTTGATCTLDFAEQVLQRYCNALPGNDEFVQLQVVTLVKAFEGGPYQATIALPSNAHAGSNNHGVVTALRTFRGPRCAGKKTAKAAACLLAVQMLYAEQLLDGYLLPASLSSQLQRGRWGAVGQVAARIINNEIQGYMPMLKLPHKLADILKKPILGPTRKPATPGARSAAHKQARQRGLFSTAGPRGATAAAAANGAAATHPGATASVVTIDTATESAANGPAAGADLGAMHSIAAQDQDTSMDTDDQDHSSEEDPSHQQQQQQQHEDHVEQDVAGPAGSTLHNAPEPSMVSAAAAGNTQPHQDAHQVSQHQGAAPAAINEDGPVVRHLYGWWVQVTDIPSHAQRGPLGSDVYTTDGPWPQRHTSTSPSSLPTSTASPGHPTPPSSSPHTAGPTPAGNTAGSQAGVAAGPVAKGGDNPTGAAAPTGLHPLFVRQVGDSWLHPYGMLLVNKVPEDSLLPFSVWLPGKQHALVACVHLGELQLTPLQLAVMQASHVCLHNLATAAAPKPLKKSTAAAPAGKDGKHKPAKKAGETTQAAGARAGAPQADVPAGNAHAAAADQAPQQQQQQQQQQRPQQQQGQQRQGQIPHTTDPDEVQSAPPQPPQIKPEPEPEMEQLDDTAGLHPHMAKVVNEVNHKSGAHKLRKALLALQAGMPAATPVQKDEALADNCYLLTPVSMTEAVLAGAVSADATNPDTAANGVSAGHAGAASSRPRPSGDIDWAALARLAAGTQAVQQMVDLGPFAMGTEATQAAISNQPAARPAANTAQGTCGGVNAMGQDMYGGMSAGRDMYGGSGLDLYGGMNTGQGLYGGMGSMQDIYGGNSSAAAAALGNAGYTGYSDATYRLTAAARREAEVKAQSAAVMQRVDQTLSGRIVMPVNNPYSRCLYAAPSKKKLPQPAGGGGDAVASSSAASSVVQQPEQVTLQSPILGASVESAMQPGGMPTYRSWCTRQNRPLPVAALPDCTPLISCLLGTGDYIRRDYTQPPSNQRQRSHKLAYRTKGEASKPQPGAADGQPAGDGTAAKATTDGAKAATKALSTAVPAGAAGKEGGQQAVPAADAHAAGATAAAAHATVANAAGANATGVNAAGASGNAAAGGPEQPAVGATDGSADMETDGAADANAPPTQPPSAAPTSTTPSTSAAAKHDLVLPDWVLRRSRPEQLLPAALLVHPLDLVEWGALTATPSLVHRLKACVAVNEFRDALQVRVKNARMQLPPLRDLLACVTAASANEAYSSEGAELLGDSVLDYLAAAYLFHYLPEQHEGVLTECKVRLVANEVLLRLTEPDPNRHGAISVPVQPYIQAKAFDRQWEWEVGCKASGNTRMKQARSGKMVADCVEAIVGAAFLHAGGTEALRLVSSSSDATSSPHSSTATATATGEQPPDSSPAVDRMGTDAGVANTTAGVGAAGVHSSTSGTIHGSDAIADGTGAQVQCQKQPKLIGPGVEGPVQQMWDARKLTAALLSSARFCHETGILPGSYDVLAAIHDAGDAPAEAKARVHAAQARTPASARLQMRDQRLSQALAPLLGGYRFRRPELLREALTHCSYHRPPCNQRLEFLGDAALDMVVTCQLVAACARHAATFSARQLHVRGVSILDPGLITEKRMRLVSNKHLSILCVRSGLHRFLRVGLPAVRALISKFENHLPQFQEEDDRQRAQQEKDIAEAAQRGEVYTIQRHKYGQSTGAPKLLADVVEAVLGAVMVDACGDLAQVWAALWGLVERAGMQHFYAWKGASISAVDHALGMELPDE